jgi:hypothetical protein
MLITGMLVTPTSTPLLLVIIIMIIGSAVIGIMIPAWSLADRPLAGQPKPHQSEALEPPARLC